jgi:protease I
MAQSLQGKRIAILATDGFEQSELEQPRQALQAAGATVEVVAPEAGEIRGWQKADWGSSVAVDRVLDQVSADEYDALLLPGA